MSNANKFWGQESSDSSSESSSSESESPVAEKSQGAGRAAPKRWAEESSSEDEGPKRETVQKKSDKRYDQLLDQIKTMKQHMKIDDFATVSIDLDSCSKMYQRVQKMAGMRLEAGGPPPQLVHALVQLEGYVEQKHQEHVEKRAATGKPALPENKGKAFNALRAKVRKTIKADYQDVVDECKANPEKFEVQKDEEPAESSSDSSSSAPGSDGGDSDDSSSSDSSDSDSSDSDSDSSSSSGSSSSGSDSDSSSSGSSAASKKSGSDSGSDDEEAAREKVMLRWVITPEKLDKRAKKDEKKEIIEQAKVKDKSKQRAKKEDKEPKDSDRKDAAPTEKEKKEEYTPEELRKKVTEIAGMRGRKGFDRRGFGEKLMELMPHALKQGPRPQLLIYSSLVSADFDGAGHAFDSMKISLWNAALEKVNVMLPLIRESYDLFKAGADEVIVDDDEQDVASHPRMQELFVVFVEKLDDELYKALQFTDDVYGSEYQDILANSSKFLVVLRRALKFFETSGQTDLLCNIATRVVEHLHYKPDALNKGIYDAMKHTVPEDERDDWIWPTDSCAYIATLCQYVHERKAEDAESLAARLQRRVALCQAYHLALHNRFQESRDMLALGNLWEKVMESDVHTMILYHRVVAQLGLSAFRLGKIPEAHGFLAELCMHNKARELLAQGLGFNRNFERTADQERSERLRQFPYHMHINLEVMESAHLICAMLLEIPNMAQQAIDPTHKRFYSRVLRRALEMHDKQQFSGPPETSKECAVTAAKAMQRGEWANACAALADLKIWAHICPGCPEAGETVKIMMQNKIKTEALRTYLFSYATFYDAFHLSQLVDMFELPAHGNGSVHSIVSKMMIKEEITAFWDESSNYVLMQHTEPTPLQRLALSLADKGAQAVDNNERLVTHKTGDYGLKDATLGRGRFDALRGGMGKGGKGGVGNFGDRGKGDRGKGDRKGGKGDRGKGSALVSRPTRDRGWGNARAAALGGGQQGWSTGNRNP